MNLLCIILKSYPLTVFHCFWIMINLSTLLWSLLNSTNFKFNLFKDKFIIFFTSLTKCPALEFPMSVIALPSLALPWLFFLFRFSFLVISMVIILLIFKCPSLQVGLASVPQPVVYRVPDKYPYVGGPGARPNKGSSVVDILPTVFYAKKWNQNQGKKPKLASQFAKLEVLDTVINRGKEANGDGETDWQWKRKRQ